MLPDIDWRSNVLEPSAGNGDLARILRDERACNVTCVEYNDNHIEFLKHIGFTDAIRADFLLLSTVFGEEFDHVVAVPPYKDNIDCLHIMHMYKFVKPGGSVISWTLPYWTTGIFKVQREFRAWLLDKDYTIKFVDEDSYVGCPKALIIINKPL